MLETLNYMIDAPHCMPTRTYLEDAGLKLVSKYAVTIPAGKSALVDTGVHFDIPSGYYGRIESNPGLMNSYLLVSMGGIVNSGDTDSIKIRLCNFSKQDCHIKSGWKIAQIIIQSCECPCLKAVDNFKEMTYGNAMLEFPPVDSRKEG